jgi:hypothetical protein
VALASEIRSELATGRWPCQITHPEWPSGSDIDPDLAVTTRRAALDRAADQPILFIGTHFATPTAGYIRRRDSASRLEV